MTTRTEELYETDFYVWTQRQAAALGRLAGSRPNVDLDFPHLIEEVGDLGTSQRDAVRSQVRGIIEHCLKLEYAQARYPRAGWRDSIIDARIELDDKLSPRFAAIWISTSAGFERRREARRRTACEAIGRATRRTCCRPTARTRWTIC